MADQARRLLRSGVALVLLALLIMTAQAEDWPDSLYTASDRTCAARICSRWWTDLAEAARCMDRYSDMVSEQLANPYRQATPKPRPSSGPSSCAGEGSEPCIDPEGVAIGRLVAIYAGLSEARAAAEMESGELAPRYLREPWERLSWCHEHYQPARGPGTYLDVLNCYHPRATMGMGEPDEVRWFFPLLPAEPLFAGYWARRLCPERSPHSSE